MREKDRPRMIFIKQEYRDVSMLIYLELKKAVRDKAPVDVSGSMTTQKAECLMIMMLITIIKFNLRIILLVFLCFLNRKTATWKAQKTINRITTDQHLSTTRFLCSQVYKK